jgi:hypothetical protein
LWKLGDEGGAIPSKEGHGWQGMLLENRRRTRRVIIERTKNIDISEKNGDENGFMPSKEVHWL